jgi:hypothetical protein
MPLHAFNQSRPKSCGAANILVILRELGRLGRIPFNVNGEISVYQQIWMSPNGDSLPHRVAQFLAQHRCPVTVIEDRNRVNALVPAVGGTAPAMLGFFRGGMAGENWCTMEDRALNLTSDFNNFARIMLVCVIAGMNGATHYILARREAGHYWLMNPDGGALNDPVNQPWTAQQFAAFLTGTAAAPVEVPNAIRGGIRQPWLGLGTVMPGLQAPSHSPRYIYSGIALRVL